jgi:hypothetical protein
MDVAVWANAGHIVYVAFTRRIADALLTREINDSATLRERSESSFLRNSGTGRVANGREAALFGRDVASVDDTSGEGICPSRSCDGRERSLTTKNQRKTVFVLKADIDGTVQFGGKKEETFQDQSFLASFRLLRTETGASIAESKRWNAALFLSGHS